MPGLVLFNRRWHIGSDDLFFPSLYGLTAHFLWYGMRNCGQSTSSRSHKLIPWFACRLIASSAVYHHIQQNASTCTPERDLRVYLVLSIAVLVPELSCETIICWISLRGTVSDDRPRRHITKALYCHLVLVLFELGVQIFGFQLLLRTEGLTCPGSSATSVVIHLLVYFSTAALLLYLISVITLFVRAIPINVEEIDHAALWRSRLGFVFKTKDPTDADGDVLSDVARVFAEFLEDAQTVPSDILVGIILLQRKQRLKQVADRGESGNETASDTSSDDDESINGPDAGIALAQRNVMGNPTTDNVLATGSHSFPPPVPPRPTKTPGGIVSDEQLRDITHFFQYAECIYGLPLFMFTNMARGLKHLLCPWARPTPTTAVAAIRTFTAPSFIPCVPAATPLQEQLPHADIVYVSLKGGLFRTPFVICYDHPRQAVVVAVRGTLSTADILVDLNCDLVEIEVPRLGNPSMKAYTHAGMWKTARNVLEEIDSAGVLAGIFSEANTYKSYRLLCVGHSLGGGVASLLAFLFRQRIHPNAEAIAYSPPGCMITGEANAYFETFCTSVVLGSDVVPRLNRHTVEKLKREVNGCIANCREHKLRVLGGVVVEWLLGRSIWNQNLRAVDPNLELGIPESPTSNQSLRRTRWDSTANPYTFLPGRVLHLRKEAPRKTNASPTGNASTLPLLPSHQQIRQPFRFFCCRRRPTTQTSKTQETFRAKWTTPEKFQEIIVSRTMGADHMPNKLGTVLEGLTRTRRGSAGTVTVDVN
ncbi:hypothetical protein HDU85_003943 [Gaertneriomyces sp. JEL0708]|nr:hypothetical protein HDU85_003943 [Gaertneriomyces sp. JEL0708]